MLVNGKPIDYSPLPQHMRGAMERYIEHRIHPGGFLTAVLCNDFQGAVKNADHINRHYLLEYIDWLLEFTPSDAWGSEEKFIAWLGERNVAA